MNEDKSKKMVADDLLRLPISYLKKEGLLKDFISANIFWPMGSYAVTVFINKSDPCVIVSYSCRKSGEEEFKDITQKVPLTTTPCRFGKDKVRYWFVCPSPDCLRRVGVLFLAGDHLGCRHCFNLSYKSRNQGGMRKKIGKIDPDLASGAWDPRNWRYYKGKPTRKFSRMLKMEEKIFRVINLYNAGRDNNLKKLEEKAGKIMSQKRYMDRLV